ncbi:hypothetical protein GQ57_09710 [Burkholderia sp. MSh2]|nr:hypothetical protein GQ57_09710 [Burkholderia sp. MSh2]KFG96784.1 hypothetical protein GQ56_0113395 [Burkholderia paludis]
MPMDEGPHGEHDPMWIGIERTSCAWWLAVNSAQALVLPIVQIVGATFGEPLPVTASTTLGVDLRGPVGPG